MLRLSRHSSARLVRAPIFRRVLVSETLNATGRPSSRLLRRLAPLEPHALRETGSDSTRWLQTGRRNAIDAGRGTRPLVCPPISSGLGQRRGLASKGGGKGGKEGEDEGMFDRLKKTFHEEIDKVLVHQYVLRRARLQVLLLLYTCGSASVRVVWP